MIRYLALGTNRTYRMANYYTRIVRVFKKKLNIPVELICNAIKNTATFENELIWNFNQIDGYLDLKWNAKRGAGDLGIDTNEFDIWEIISSGNINIFHHNSNKEHLNTEHKFIFSFDSIYIKSSNVYLNETYFKNLVSEQLDYLEIDSLIEMKGNYKSSCGYEIGEINQNNENTTREVNTKELLLPRGDFIMLNKFGNNFKNHEDLNKFLNLTNLYWKADEYQLFEGFKEIQFLWQGRIVNTIERNENPNDMWIGKNSDWWDNCNLPAWIKFNDKRKNAR